MEKNTSKIPEGWEITKLKVLAEIRRGASPRPIADKKWFSNNSNIGWIRISDVTKTKKYLIETEQYLSAEGIKKSRLVKNGDLIMSICATLGKPILLGMDACIHDGFVVFDGLNYKKVNREFLFYFLQNNENNFLNSGQIGTQSNLNTTLVGLTEILLPPLSIQNKITLILSDLDDLIENTDHLINSYTLLKKA